MDPSFCICAKLKKKQYTIEAIREIEKQLKDNGFIVLSDNSSLSKEAKSNVDQKKLLLVITLSEKLIKKLSIKYNLKFDSEMTTSSDYGAPNTALLLAYEYACLIVYSITNADEVWISTDKYLTRNLVRFRRSSQLCTEMNKYYGSKIALYFGFLSYYSDQLIYPALGGMMLYWLQIYGDANSSKWIGIFCVFISLWSTYILEFWKRRCARYDFEWNSNYREDHEIDELLIKIRTAKENESLIKLVRCFISLIISIAYMVVLVIIMIRFRYLQRHANEMYETKVWKMYPTVMYSIVPIISNGLWTRLSKILNKLESHSLKITSENLLILKTFIVQFVNHYCALLYLTFWEQDIVELGNLLMWLLTTKAIIHQLQELVSSRMSPFRKKVYRMMQNLWKSPPQSQLNSSVNSQPLISPPPKIIGKSFKNERDNETKNLLLSTRGGSVRIINKTEPLQPNTEKVKGDDFVTKVIENEYNRMSYDVDEDYLEVLIQFGYVAMFAVAFPLAPFFAWFNNLFEFSIDTMKLTYSKKPPYEMRSDSGAWIYCLEFMSFCAVITNCFLLIMMSKSWIQFIPTEFQALFEVQTGKILAMLLLEHCLIGFKLLIVYGVDDIPASIREAQAKAQLETIQLAHSKRLALYQMQQVSLVNSKQNNASSRFGLKTSSFDRLDSTRGNYFSQLDSNIPLSQAIEGWMEEPSPMKPTTNSMKSRDSMRNYDGIGNESQETGASMLSTLSQGSLFAFNPFSLSALCIAPSIIDYFHIHPALYYPMALLFLTYFQIQKDRNDRNIAMGIVTNSTLIKLIQKELPPWISDSDFERVEWFNTILQKLWNYLSKGSEKLAKEKLQPILNKNKPFFISVLNLRQLSLGTKAPKIVGIRVYNTPFESNVRFDIEIRWAGDPKVVMEIGIQPIPITVELSDIRISAIIRIELLDLSYNLPCIDAISITLMRPPVFEFSLKLAQMNVMNLGFATELSVAALVRNIFNSILQQIIIFPKKLIIPLNPSVDIHKLKAMKPIGILSINLAKAENLKSVNLTGGSDPYVELKTLDQEFKSTTKYRTTFPIWNETFDIMIFDKHNQTIEMSVYDANKVQSNIFLGRAMLRVDKLSPYERYEKTFDLVDIPNPKGNLTVSYTYMELNNPSTPRKMSDDMQDDYPYSPSQKLFSQDDSFSNSMDGVATITISAIQLKNFNPPSVGIAGFLDRNPRRPLINFSIGLSKKETQKSLNGVRDPLFEESFSFIVKLPAMDEVLTVQVVERLKISNSTIVCGQIHFRVVDILDGNLGNEIEKHIDGIEGNANCMIAFKLSWSISEK